MKKLYTFSINKIEKIETKTKQEDGSILVTFKDEITPVKIAIKKPDRLETDEYQLVYDAEYSKAILSGVATIDMMRKALLNAEGLNAQVDMEHMDNVFRDLQKYQNTYQKLVFDNAPESEVLETEEIIKNLTKEVMEYKEREESFFSRTAESRAKRKTIFWCVLNLLFFERIVDGKEVYEPVFEGSTFESKKSLYYNLIEESDDSFEERVFQKGYFIIQSWISGTTIEGDDFALLEQIVDEHIAANKPTPS
jgi:hypothetical protein